MLYLKTNRGGNMRILINEGRKDIVLEGEFDIDMLTASLDRIIRANKILNLIFDTSELSQEYVIKKLKNEKNIEYMWEKDNVYVYNMKLGSNEILVFISPHNITLKTGTGNPSDNIILSLIYYFK